MTSGVKIARLVFALECASTELTIQLLVVSTRYQIDVYGHTIRDVSRIARGLKIRIRAIRR